MSQTQTPVEHPKGLYVLFTTEMWERFNFYGMRAILTLFMVNALRFSEAEASVIYGGFLGLCYLTPMLGGFISDRFWGNRKCILFGGTTMAVGQLLLFACASLYDTNIDLSKNIMWVALGVLILGNGFFKPNISSMVGSLYPKGDNRLDSAFTIFYLGINLGAFIGITICPILGDVKLEDGTRVVSAFKWGFLAAGAAMLLGTVVFLLLKDKYVTTPDGKAIGGKPSAREDGGHEKSKFSNSSIVTALVALVALFFIFLKGVGVNPIYSFIYSSGLTLAGFILSDKSLTKIERDRIIVLYFVAFFVIFFWACFEQAGSSLTFIADNQTDTHIFGWQMPPSLVQNANSLFIILFAFPFSWLWLKMARRNIEPTSPFKQGIGLLLIALGFLIIAFAVKGIANDSKINVMWLVVLYLLHTLGELCLSPIGLSLVSKLAPMRFASLLMGVWFLSNASGYALAGTLGALLPPTGDKYIKAEEMGIDLKGVLDKSITLDDAKMQMLTDSNIPTEYPVFAGFAIHDLFEFFMVFVILPGSAGIILLLLTGWLKKMMHGVH